MTLVLSWHLKVCTLNGKDYLQILKTGKKAQKNRLKSINLKFEDTMFPIARAETNRKLHDIAL